jgi:uncharacterized membrane protein (DUF2068 family)
MAGDPNALGLRLIIGYKFARAAAGIALGAGLLALGAAGLAAHLNDVVDYIRHHAAAAWSIALVEYLLDVATGRMLKVVSLAILVDGLFSLFEGWVLYRRYAWSRWLIVITTASLVPLECYSLYRHLSTARIAILLVNVLIVLYLVRRRTAAPAP